VKAVELDPAAICIASEIAVINRHDVVVTNWRNTTLVHRAPKRVTADADRAGSLKFNSGWRTTAWARPPLQPR